MTNERIRFTIPQCCPSYQLMERPDKNFGLEFGPFHLDGMDIFSGRVKDFGQVIEDSFQVVMEPMYKKITRGPE